MLHKLIPKWRLSAIRPPRTRSSCYRPRPQQSSDTDAHTLIRLSLGHNSANVIYLVMGLMRKGEKARNSYFVDAAMDSGNYWCQKLFVVELNSSVLEKLTCFHLVDVFQATAIHSRMQSSLSDETAASDTSER
ncbi:uncharacterized protein LOC129748912 [Uranotaenia lowii]|uniref:uncharacterized protein LOC129748912 n=1 Tax=Uranotaenia lowii TaxID=190385 RepID=UPI002479AAD3|nr:uncharacterized protein LOC129748912 [Uranotaenia lowii]